MDAHIFRTLAESTDQNAVADAAGTLAASKQPDDLATLGQFLNQPDFFRRLDDDDDYFGIAEDLRIAGVFETLEANDQPARDQLLTQLTLATPFLAEESRIELLISALRVVRPANEAVIRFWDKHCQPNDGYCSRTIEAAAANGSDPALQFFASKLSSPSFDVADRADWLHKSVLPRRDQLPILQMSANVLIQSDELGLKLAIIDSLFDYRKEEWYSMHTKIVPPMLENTAADSRQFLKELAERLKQSAGLPEQQRDAVEATLQQLTVLEGG